MNPNIRDVIRTLVSSPLRRTRPVMQQQSKMAPDYVSFGFSFIVALGGVMGYVKAGSIPSLGAGLTFGGIAMFGAYQTSQNPKNVWVSLATSLLLAGVMGSRFVRSGKFMPAGMVTSLSVLQALRMSYRLTN